MADRRKSVSVYFRDQAVLDRVYKIAESTGKGVSEVVLALIIEGLWSLHEKRQRAKEEGSEDGA